MQLELFKGYILPSRKGINPTINLRFDENI